MDPTTVMGIIMGLGTLANLLFGGEPEQTTTQKTTTPPAAPFDPAYGLLSPTMLSGLLKNFNLFSGAGMPSGTPDIFGNMGLDIQKLLAEEWPKIIEEYKGTTKTAQGERKKTATEFCGEKYKAGSPEYRRCVAMNSQQR